MSRSIERSRKRLSGSSTECRTTVTGAFLANPQPIKKAFAVIAAPRSGTIVWAKNAYSVAAAAA